MPNSEAAILTRLFQSKEQAVTPDVARYLLSFAFAGSDVERMNYLASGAQRGEITGEEQAELDSYLHVSNLLAILQSPARVALRAVPPSAQ